MVEIRGIDRIVLSRGKLNVCGERSLVVACVVYRPESRQKLQALQRYTFKMDVSSVNCG